MSQKCHPDSRAYGGVNLPPLLSGCGFVHSSTNSLFLNFFILILLLIILLRASFPVRNLSVATKYIAIVHESNGAIIKMFGAARNI